MGNSTGSMFYLFVIVIVLYIVGASYLSGISLVQEMAGRKRDEKFSMDNEENKE